MTIVAAVTDSKEGHQALVEAVVEARHLGVDLVAVNLGSIELKATDLDTDGVTVTVVDRQGQRQGGVGRRRVRRDRRTQGDSPRHRRQAPNARSARRSSAT